MKRLIKAAITAIFVLSVGFAGTVSATQPTDGPPGQGECEHGNSGQPCRPDPQPSHGADCDEHGPFEGGVNEDHCLPEVTPSPSIEPSPTPSATPTSEPSPEPSSTPSASPSSTPLPSVEPTPVPSTTPSPSTSPSETPTLTPSPTAAPTESPSIVAPRLTPPPTDTSAEPPASSPTTSDRDFLYILLLWGAGWLGWRAFNRHVLDK